MAAISVGCGQITWLRFTQQGAEWSAPEEQVLAEIARAGYDGAPAGPGQRTPEEARALYASVGMRPAPGYYSADFWKADQRDTIVANASAFADYTRALGLTEMYVATGGWDYTTQAGQTRPQLAGRIREEHGLSDGEMRQFAATLAEVCEAARERGVTCCFHNHVGTVIETRAELERLLALIDPGLLALGPDTGHLAWAGDDPVAFCRDYAARIKTLHVKDIDAGVAAEGRALGWDYRTCVAHGVWTELGEGQIDFGAIFDSLKRAGFSGWAIVETDVTQKASAFESARICREYLRGIGI
jgi:inosose dehydratase